MILSVPSGRRVSDVTVASGAHRVQVGGGELERAELALAHHHEFPVAGDGGLDGRARQRPTHEQRRLAPREERHVQQRQHRVVDGDGHLIRGR